MEARNGAARFTSIVPPWPAPASCRDHLGDSFARAAPVLGRQMQSDLGPPPEHVLGRPRPFVLLEVAHLALGQSMAEVPPHAGEVASLAEHALGVRAVAAREPAQEIPGEAGSALVQVVE